MRYGKKFMGNDKSLLNLFMPPRPDLKGQIGFLSGYSASEEFLDRALENFTTLGKLQRAEQGLLSLVLFLDKRCKQITSVTGLQHEMFSGNDRAFSLMHAKVGLLSFAKNKYSKIEFIRVFVSTGNWTRQGMVDNLDHAWKLDIELIEERSADLMEARKILNFFKTLSSHYPLLKKSEEQLKLIDAILPISDPSDELKKTKFFSTFDVSREKPLSMLESIKSRLRKDKNSKPFNTLICGSGFFEETDSSAGAPKKELRVFREIEEKLCASEEFTNKVNGYVVANAHDYIKFKSLIKQKGNVSWNLRGFRDPVQKNQNQIRSFLHSKYILAGYRHGERLTSGKIYFGSANLSKKGLLYNLQNPEANIEAGVVLDASGLSNDEVDALLCIGPDAIDESQIDGTIASTLPEFEDSVTIFAAPIKAIVNFDLRIGTGTIEWSNLPKDCYLNLNGKRIDVVAGQSQILFGDFSIPLSQLNFFVSHTDESFVVPLITTDGRFCLHPPEQVSAESLLNLLLVFPDSLAGSDDDDEGAGIRLTGANLVGSEQTRRGSSRVLNTAMELVEQIARKNQEITIDLLPIWLDRLQFILTRCLAPSEKISFQKIGINFLDVLKEAHFSPNWEKLAATLEQREFYNAMIDDIAADWDVKQFNKLAEVHDA